MKTGLAIGLCAGALIIGGGGGFAVNYMVNKPTIETFEQQVAALQASLDAIGPLTTLYTVKSPTKPGEEITLDMLEEQSVPASFVAENTIQETAKIVGKYSKVAITTGTPITADLLMDDDINDEKALWHTVRYYDVVANMWPSAGLDVGKYVDLRMIMPNGEEYIVLSHMRIEGISDATVRFLMTEVQIALYQSALVDYYLNVNKGVTFYFVEYLEPGVQKPAVVNYKVSEEIKRSLEQNPNLYATAVYTAYDTIGRSFIENDLVPTEEDAEKTPEDLNGELSAGRGTWASTINGSAGSYRDVTLEELEGSGSGNSGNQGGSSGIVW